MLLAAASVLLLATLLTGVGGPVGSALAAALWLFASVKKAPPVFVSSSEGSTSRASLRLVGMLVVLVVLVGATGALRWPIASHDVEHYPAPDEGEVVENVLEMIRMGDFDQRHPGYPGLHFYLQMLPAHAHMAATGKTIPELPRTGFYLGARRLTLAAGVLVVGIVFWIGCQWLSTASAGLAASLVALSPLVFRESGAVSPDLMLTLFVLVSSILSLRLLESRTWASFALAGMSIGLASAIKYTGVFALVPFALAWLVGPSPRRDASKWVSGLALSGIVFAATSPYTILNLGTFVRGLSMHVGYYQAAELNAPLALTRQIATRGVGIVASVAAAIAAVRALSGIDKRLLVLLGYPLTYWFVFSFFDRAFPRHALVLIPVVALLAADTFDRLASRLPSWAPAHEPRPGGVWARVALGLVFIAAPLVGTIDLWRRVGRDTPADAAHSWALASLPPGSRILQDQHTPRLDDDGFRVHRLRVEEKQFVGNYEWVLHSGYPPGLSTRGLREVARFENDDALGDLIVAYQVPPRETLMPRTFRSGEDTATIRAGELPFFGEGWYPPTSGAFETARLSRGESSEIFFVVDEATNVEARLVIGAAVDEGSLSLTLNGESRGALTYQRELETHSFSLDAEAGLNRLVLTYEATRRLNRRHQDTAIRFFRLELGRE